MRSIAFFVLALAAASGSGSPQPAEGLDVRFYPGGPLYTYELDNAHGATSLLIHNIAVINHGPGPVDLKSVELELRAGGRVLDLRTLHEDDLRRAATTGSQMQAAGMLEPLAFMFGGARLLPAGTKLPASTTLAPGQAILISTQVFGYRGARDEFVVRAVGANTTREVKRPITAKGSATVFALPLHGVWLDAMGPSLHSPHRWVPMEQFAHDFIRLGGPEQKSYRTDGQSFADYLAYGQPVYAAAAGTVIAMADSEGEDVKAMRRTGEPLEAYFQRLQADQMARLSSGRLGVTGNYVMIDHGNGEYSLYAHLKPKSVRVRVGQKLALGEALGAVGSSGNSTEPHLHFQVCDGPDPLMCAGIPPTWRGLGLSIDDFPRAPQSGDMVYDLKTPKDPR